MPSNTPVYLEALTCLEHGISIIPITPASARGSKRPAVPWKTYQQKLATRADAARWFHDHQHGLAAVCGEISGGLIMIELEGRAADKLPQLRETSRERGAETTDLFHKLTTGWAEISPSGGFHFYARTPENTHGNRKLARTKDGTVLAETRENGGYTVIAPTGGEYHETGRAWTRLAGGPTTLPTFTLTQLDTLLDIFRTLDEAGDAPTLTSSRARRPDPTPTAPAAPAPQATREAGGAHPPATNTSRKPAGKTSSHPTGGPSPAATPQQPTGHGPVRLWASLPRRAAHKTETAYTSSHRAPFLPPKPPIRNSARTRSSTTAAT